MSNSNAVNGKDEVYEIFFARLIDVKGNDSVSIKNDDSRKFQLYVQR